MERLIYSQNSDRSLSIWEAGELRFYGLLKRNGNVFIFMTGGTTACPTV